MNTESEKATEQNAVEETSTEIVHKVPSMPNSDFVNLKNELLQIIQNLETDFVLKLHEQESHQNDAMVDLANKVNELYLKFTNLNEGIAQSKVKIAKIDEFDGFKKKADDQLITHEIRLNQCIKDLENAKYKYDKIFLENLTVSGYVGPYAQFKTMADYISYNIQTVDDLVNSKNQIYKDLKENLKKVDSNIKDVCGLVNVAEKKINERTDTKIELVYQKIEDKGNETNDKLMQLRVENCQVSMELKEKLKEFMEEWDKITKIRDDISKNLNDHLFLYKTDFDSSMKQFHEIKTEFNKMKNRFGDMIDFIKDVRFRKNLSSINGPQNEVLIKKSEIDSLANKINPRRKMSKSIDLSNERQIDLDYDFQTGKSVREAASFLHSTPQSDNEHKEKSQPRALKEKFMTPKEEKRQNETILKVESEPTSPHIKTTSMAQSQRQGINSFVSLGNNLKLSNTVYSSNVGQKSRKPAAIKEKPNLSAIPKTTTNLVMLDFETPPPQREFLFTVEGKKQNDFNVELRPINGVKRKEFRNPKLIKDQNRVKISFGSTMNNFYKKDAIDCSCSKDNNLNVAFLPQRRSTSINNH